jgi:hypothetical protein
MNKIERIFDQTCSRSEFSNKYNLICETVPADAEIRLYTCPCCDQPHFSVLVCAGISAYQKANLKNKLIQIFQ